MRTYIVKEKKFSFQGKDSYDIPLMGRSSMEMLLSEFPEAECLSEEDFDLKKFNCEDGALIIKSSFPMFNRQIADKVTDAFKKNRNVTLKFPAGVLISKNAYSGSDSIEIFCGTALDSLTVYHTVIDEVRKHILFNLMKDGVMIESPSSTYISYGVKIESGVEIRHDCHITGDTVIKSGAVINPYSNIKDSFIDSFSCITSSTLEKAKIGKHTTVGPNAYLRPASVIGDGCRIGDFVEIKNANIGNGTKVSHLSYVGDADVGERVNIGCGVVFVNYDGRHKNRSKVGNECFLGSNSNLVAPVVLEDNSFVAAGTTLTKDLKSGDFCIGRCRETIKPDRAYNYFGSKQD